MNARAAAVASLPILLYNGECAVCRIIAGWVGRSALDGSGRATLIEQPIGDDPEALRVLNPNLGIWDAYETIHLLMPDGSMKVGGSAVAEVLRTIPSCSWFSWSFAVAIFGFRPFQMLLDIGYTVLSDIRPILGCESCGIPSPWVSMLGSAFAGLQGKQVVKRHPAGARFTPRPSFSSARVSPSESPARG